MSRPVPKPRRQTSCPDKTEDTESVKSRSTSLSATNAPQVELVRSAPPPVLPKKWTVKKTSGGGDSVKDTVERVKVVPEQSINASHKLSRSLLAPQPSDEQSDEEDEILDANSLMDGWKNVKSWKSLCTDLKLKGVTEEKIITAKAKHLYKAVQRYIFLLSERVGTLKEHTTDLLSIADNLDKVSKGTKIAGITGGTTAVAGGVAAAAGVILSPFTLGASLALTAVGVGMAAAGGVTGASAAIANKVNVSQDKKKIEKTFEEYSDRMEDIQDCLVFVSEGMEQLKKHDLSALSEARKVSDRVAGVIEMAATGGASARAIEANSKASGMMHGFALGMDMYFTKGKNGQKLKKGLESKFGKKIREIAEGLNAALDELIQIKDLFNKHCSGK